jgi:hypothetical protein
MWPWFRFVTDERTPQRGKLSPTLKLKRNLIPDHYSDKISGIYYRGKKDNGVLGFIKVGINGILKNLPKF